MSCFCQTARSSLQADGKILVGGTFNALQPNGAQSPANRKCFARLSKDPALDDLFVENPNTVTWLQGGSLPDLSHLVFEQSSDDGATWVSLGTASRVSGSFNWRLSGVTLPTAGKLRAYGRTPCGSGNGSHGWLKSEVTYIGLGAPEIAVRDSARTDLTSGVSISDLGAVATGGHRLFQITIRNLGGGDLFGISAALSSGEAEDFSVTSSPPAVIPAGGTAYMIVRFVPSALWAGLPAGDLIDGNVSRLAIHGDSATGSENLKFSRVQFVRRKRSGLVYTVKKSITLGPDSFVIMTGEQVVEDIDEEWERVSILEPFDTSVIPRLFTKVEVTVP